MKNARCLAKIFLAIGLLTLIVLRPAVACIGNNHARPADVVSDDVSKLFEEKNYTKLDEMARQYEKKRVLTSDSNSALMAFYRGIAKGLSSCAKKKNTDEDWRAHQQSILDWMQSSPNSTAAKLALAFFTIDYGWHARGSGYASTVDDDAMALFKSRVAAARGQLERLAASCKNNPAWYAGMLDVALAQGWTYKEFNTIYQQAVKLDPYYLKFHYTNAHFYSAVWYGSKEQLNIEIEKSVALTKKRLGQSMYADLHWTYESPDMFENGDVDWARMKIGFDDMLRIYPDDLTRNNYGKFACMAKDAKSIKQQLDQLGTRVDPKKWDGKEFFSYCQALAKNSETGKATECFKRADTGEVFCE